MAFTRSEPLSGVGAVGQVGTVTAAGSDVVVALTGVSATGSVGNVSAVGGDSRAGSGGFAPWSQGRRAQSVPVAAQRVIERVAKRQVKRPRDDRDLERELEVELRRAKVQWDAYYATILEGLRDRLVVEQLQREFEKLQRAEESDMLMVLANVLDE